MLIIERIYDWPFPPYDITLDSTLVALLVVGFFIFWAIMEKP